jgi:hypothetical protein
MRAARNPLLAILAIALVLSGRSIGDRERADWPRSVEATPRTGACTAAPRTFDEIQFLRRRAEGSPPAALTPGPIPTGQPASPTEVAAVRAVVEELVACFATGEPLRVWGLYSDAYLARLLYRQRGFDRRLYDAYATPRPAGPGEFVEIRSISDVVRLGDGRIGATVVLYYPGIGMGKRFFFVIVEIDARWRIDEIVGEISFSLP